MDNQQTREVLQTEIVALSDLSLPELRSLWRLHYQSDAPKRMSRELMVRAIAYSLQEKTFGGPSRRTKAKLTAYAEANSRHARHKPQTSRVTIKPGTQLVRQWHGRVHTVTAGSDCGLVYRDECYRSLSQIARTITCPRWS